MIVTDVWSLHYEHFLIQIDGTKEETEKLHKMLEDSDDKGSKQFVIVLKGGKL